jgi:hypothetical protein
VVTSVAIATDPTRTEVVEVLQGEIWSRLTELATTADLVELLLDTRQSLSLAEQAAAGPHGKSAHAPVPGSLAAYSMAAEIRFTLLHDAAFITRHLRRAQICALVRPLPTDPTVTQLIGHVRALVAAAPSPRLLRAVQVDIDQVTEAAGVVVDGNPETFLAEPCPHCERPTLVAHQYPDKPDQDVVLCARDRSSRRDRRYRPCICKTEECPCHIDPTRWRHQWFRVLGNRADGWGTLGRLIDARRETKPDQNSTETDPEGNPT